MSYRIKSVAALTGINSATLRAWERRYRLVTPHRTPGGYRVYSDQDVDTIARVKALLERGLKVSEAVEIVRRGESTPTLPEVASDTESTLRVREAVLEALLDFDRAAADRLYDRLGALSFPDRVEEVLMPILRRVGELWASGEATVTQEHFTAVFAREKLESMLGFLSAAPADGPEVVFAGLPGEQHELGLLGVAVHLAAGGWRVTYLGADVPFADLQATLAERAPSLLCTSIILPISHDQCRAVALRLRELAPKRTAVVIGGAGIPEGVPEVNVRGVTMLRRFREGNGILTPPPRA
ncbi:MAG TPA: MerR family transcriptional regulator [Longimicrobiaceae bacterium]|nr:MerR family transcriptional regulator [Longimicrobiaceae bacterium]